jgi:hypothetical protein
MIRADLTRIASAALLLGVFSVARAFAASPSDRPASPIFRLQPREGRAATREAERAAHAAAEGAAATRPIAKQSEGEATALPPEPSEIPCVPPVLLGASIWPYDGAVEVSRTPELQLYPDFSNGYYNRWSTEYFISKDECNVSTPACSESGYQTCRVELEPGTTYRWKGRISNPCGTVESICNSFTTTACTINEKSDLAVGTLQSFDVEGDRGYAVTGRFLDVWDLADPDHPARIGRYDSGHGCTSAVARGSIVYLSTSERWDPFWNGLGPRLQVVDFADPAAPVLRAELDLGRIMAVGGNLLVAKQPSPGVDLAILDISSPFAPALRGFVPWASTAQLSGNLLFTGDSPRRIWDLADPSDPVLRYEGNSAFGSGVASGNWYFSDPRSGSCFEVWSIADPSHPAFFSSASCTRWQQIAGFRGNDLLVESGGELELWSVADPAHPGQTGGGFPFVGKLLSSDGARAVMSLYGSNGRTEMGVAEWSVWPPRLAARIAPYGPTLDAVMKGQYLIEANHGRGLVIHDLSDPDQPVETKQIDLWGAVPYRLQLDGDLLLVSNVSRWSPETEYAELFDVSEPANPLFLGGAGPFDQDWLPRLANGLVYGVTPFVVTPPYQRIEVWDPASGSGDPIGATDVYLLLASGGKVFVAGTTVIVATHAASVRLIDFSNPSHPVVRPAVAPYYEDRVFNFLKALPGGRFFVAAAACNYWICSEWNMIANATDVENPLGWTEFPGSSIPGFSNDYYPGGGVAVWGNYLFEGGNRRIAISNFSGATPLGPTVELPTKPGDSETLGFFPSADGRLAVAPQRDHCRVFDVSTCTHPVPIAVVDVKPGGPIRLCQHATATNAVDPVRLDAAARLTSGSCANGWTWRWTSDGQIIPGATSATLVTPTSLSNGLHRYQAEARCRDGASLVAWSNFVEIEVKGAPPGEVVDLRIADRSTPWLSAATAHWADLPGVSDYEIGSDSVPTGSFTTFVGRGVSGSAGVPIVLPEDGEDRYYLVLAVNGCRPWP